MQAYRDSFASIYNLRWGDFARYFAPRIRQYYESTPVGQENKSMLDLCCGAGHLALHFLEAGYRVTGIDLSQAMLQYARKNTEDYNQDDQVVLIQADAADFVLSKPVGLVVSTYDSLNHLENFSALKSCFHSVYAALLDGGTFIFDLNTRAGLKAQWNNIAVEDTEELTLITRSIFDEENERAWTHISGFLRQESGLYTRFEETAFNTVFEMNAVRDALLETGWQQVDFACGQDLNVSITNPEDERRVFIIARK
jgi:SAM-dependent methyltransferase